MPHDSRTTMLHWAEFAIGGLIAFALAGVVGLLVSIRATRENTALDARLRMAESKLSDMAFIYRCDECQTVFSSDWHQPTTCRACGNQRRFCFVGVHDTESSRGYTKGARK